MDTTAVREALVEFAKSYKAELQHLSSRKYQLLEVGLLAVCAEHYRLAGYDVSPMNLQGGSFKVKLGSGGFPWNFSWFECERHGKAFELHSNLSVYSAYRKDDGIYVVDVGVAKGGVVPRSRPSSKWRAVENQHLITFAEAKSLVIYPMLLAQFTGIVTEITPGFLRASRPKDFCKEGHFDPALISVGYLHGRARSIARAYHDRGYYVKIVPNMDNRLSSLRHGGRFVTSVLAREDEATLDREEEEGDLDLEEGEGRLDQEERMGQQGIDDVDLPF